MRTRPTLRVLAAAGWLGAATVVSGSSAAAEPESLWAHEALTGDWGGLRTQLSGRGVELGLTYTGDRIEVVSGGLRHRGEYLSDWDLTLSLDTEPLFGWRGGTVFVYGLGVAGTDGPSESAGDIQTLDNIDAPDDWSLYEAWVQQVLLDGRLSLLAGLYDVNGEFDVLDSAALFINSSFGIAKDFSQSGENGPSIFPETSLGVRIAVTREGGSYARFAVLDGVPGDPAHEHSKPALFALSSDDGALFVAELGRISGEEEGSQAPRAKLGLGGWYYTARFERIDSVDAEGNPHRQQGSYGMYLLGERALYREADAPERGLTAFARVGFANTDVNPVGVYAGTGAVYTGLVPGRPEDQLGLGVAAAFAGHEYENTLADEGVDVEHAEVAFELSYRAQLTPWLALQPDVQFIVHPGFDGDVDDALALGARVEVSF